MESPKDVGEIYERILNQIPEHQCKYVLQALQWLAFSECPLTLQGLAAAPKVDIEGSAPVKDDNEVPVLRAVLNMCSSLVTITPRCFDEDDGYFQLTQQRFNKDVVHIQLAHLSVRNYLTSEQIQTLTMKHFSFSAKSAHTLIGWTCLFVLLRLDNLDGWECGTPFPSSSLQRSVLDSARCVWEGRGL